MAKIKISMTIDDEVFLAFKTYCQQNGMKISTKVEQLMRENIKNMPLQAFIR
jgi:antitoxin component of RelBE/YafQ-DinJ toxin-antitoxin module